MCTTHTRCDELRTSFLCVLTLTAEDLDGSIGRHFAGKDLKWWNKKGEGGADAARAQAEMEKARVKQLDEDLLNEAL